MAEGQQTEDFDSRGRIFKIRHMALRNALYHQARRRCLDGINRFFNLLIILGGTGTAAELTRGSATSALWLGGAIASAGAVQLVFDYTGRARLHEILQRRYYNLMADVEGRSCPSEEECARWESEFSRAAADEPPTMRALDAIAYNQATFALCGGSQPHLKVTWWQSLTRQVLVHNGASFPPLKPTAD